MELYTTFDGRIGRQRLWLGVIGLLVVSILANIALTAVVGGNPGLLSLLTFIVSLILLYPALAVAIKRLHDRNKSATPWAFIFFGPGLLLQVMQVLGIGFSTQAIEGVDVMIPTALGGLVMAVATIVGIWALVELGFLKGTQGANHFGPDPLQQ